MSLHKSSERRMMHNRRATKPSNGNSGGNGNGNDPGNAAPSNTPSPSSAPSQTPSQSASASPSSSSDPPTTPPSATGQSASSQSQPATTTSTNTPVTPATSATPASTSSSPSLAAAVVPSSSSQASSTTSSSSSPSTPLSTSTSTHFSTVIPSQGFTTQDRPASLDSIIISSTSAASATSTSSTSSDLNTGAIVGGIAGGLAGLAILGVLLACVLRRINKRKRAAKFEAAQFRRSAMILDDNDFGAVPRPPQMVQNRENNYTNSVTSSTGPGMAGAGAYRIQPEDVAGIDNATGFVDDHDFFRDQAGQQYYDQSPTAAHDAAVLMQRSPLQPKPQYTFGQAPVETFSGNTNHNPFVVEAHAMYGDQYGAQAYHTAGAHPSGYHATQPDIGSGFDESEAYGGI